MAIFSMNGADQLIVANAYNTSGTAAGTVTGVVAKGGEVSIKYINALAKKVSSDRIPIGKVRAASAKATVAKTYRTDTISIASGNVVVGQEYSIKMVFRNWGSGSAENQYPRIIGGYVAKTGDDAEDIFTAIAANGNAIMKREAWPMVNFTVSGTGSSATLVITEQPQKWILGKMQARQLDYTITFIPITLSGVEVLSWGTVATVMANPGLGNGKDMADFEYFLMGERGDQYKYMGFPYNIDTTYLVDSSSSYDIITISYYFDDIGVYVQKSEKTLYILCKVVNGNHDIAIAIVTALNVAGITIADNEVNLVTAITVSGAAGATTITVDGGTLQMSATVTPSTAHNTDVVWSVIPGTGTATINSTGLLTATSNGTVTVRATAADGSGVYDDQVITITNQA